MARGWWRCRRGRTSPRRSCSRTPFGAPRLYSVGWPTASRSQRILSSHWRWTRGRRRRACVPSLSILATSWAPVCRSISRQTCSARGTCRREREPHIDPAKNLKTVQQGQPQTCGARRARSSRYGRRLLPESRYCPLVSEQIAVNQLGSMEPRVMPHAVSLQVANLWNLSKQFLMPLNNL
jgi:hypothetical protein